MDLLHIAASALSQLRADYDSPVPTAGRCEIAYTVMPPNLFAEVTFPRCVCVDIGSPIPEKPWQARERQQEGAQ